MPNLLAAISGVQRFVRNTRRNSIVTREKEQARCAAAYSALLYMPFNPHSRPRVFGARHLAYIRAYRYHCRFHKVHFLLTLFLAMFKMHIKVYG
jgi:hypothetical protein